MGSFFRVDPDRSHLAITTGSRSQKKQVLLKNMNPKLFNHTSREDLIAVALGEAPADLIVRGGKLVNVLTAEIYKTDIAIKGDRIASIDSEAAMIGKKTKLIEANDAFLVPGLVEPHFHTYHSYVTPTVFARAVLPHGTTTLADGFYGQGIVGGIRAVRFFLDELKKTPLKLAFLVPVLAYLQNRELGLPPAPNSISADEMFEMLCWKECLGLEEPPYLPILQKDPVFVRLFNQCLEQKKIIIGMASGIDVKGLNAYVCMGPLTDHESVTAEEAVQKVRRGLKILMREASGSLNVKELSKAISKYHIDSRAFAFCVDLATPDRLASDGHLDANIRAAIAAGVEPITAVQMATINPSEILRLNYEVGSITAGKIADILLVPNLRSFRVRKVIANGQLVAHEGNLVARLSLPRYPNWMFRTLKLKKSLEPSDFEIRASRGLRRIKVWVIGVSDDELLTEKQTAVLKVDSGIIQPESTQDVLRIAMIDRFDSTGSVGKGFVRGFGLKGGALGISVNAVCENILIVGKDSDDMSLAGNALVDKGGGIVVVAHGAVKAIVELPLLGLLSDKPLPRLLRQWARLHRLLREMGCVLKTPISTLEFTGASGEMEALKICDEGYLDVKARKLIDVKAD